MAEQKLPKLTTRVRFPSPAPAQRGVRRPGARLAQARPAGAPPPTDGAAPPRRPFLNHPTTPDGRYFVVRGRLWRTSDPSLPPDRRQALVRDLMHARSAVGTARRAGDAAAEAQARAAVHAAKVELGERGPPWWHDGAPDLNRRMARTTIYADWFAALDAPPKN